MTLKAGMRAPDFTLPDQTGKTHTLSKYIGSCVLLYFYTKDMTPGCTTEACEIRDNIEDFKKMKTKVLGVSVDSVKSHKKFSDAYTLPFPILSDEENRVVKEYGVWGKKKFMGHEYEGTSRVSFLIDPKGIISKIYESVKPKEHAGEVISDVQSKK